MSKIAVTGSLHYDIMLDAPHRPEKGETVMGSACHYKFGGKGGNQAVAAARAGAAVRFAGAVGSVRRAAFCLSSCFRRAWIAPRLPPSIICRRA
ncbi:sugar/nucleoside kinase (ribokinase family) [Pantoea sp. UYEF8]